MCIFDNYTFDEKTNKQTSCLSYVFVLSNVDLIFLSVFCVWYISVILIKEFEILGNNVLIIVLSVILVVSLILMYLSSVGAFKRKTTHLITYIFVTIMIVLLLVGILSILVLNLTHLKQFLTNRWNNMSQSQQQSIEKEWKCCGMSEDSINKSDCMQENQSAGTKEEYCYVKIKRVYKSQIIVFSFCFGVFIFIKLISVILGIKLIKFIKNYDKIQHTKGKHKKNESTIVEMSYDFGSLQSPHSRQSIQSVQSMQSMQSQRSIRTKSYDNENINDGWGGQAQSARLTMSETYSFRNSASDRQLLPLPLNVPKFVDEENSDDEYSNASSTPVIQASF